MGRDDDRKMLANKALEKMRWTVRNVSAEHFIHQITPLDKNEFVTLLRTNFERLDKDHSKGITRDEILHALMHPGDLKPYEHVMLQLLLRYFDFIADLVDDTDGKVKAISKQDVEVLSQFLLNSELNLEELYLWLGGQPNQQKPDITPPPLSSSNP